jgi:uncharacterized protein YutE (UPF0331/DUF86 family)
MTDRLRLDRLLDMLRRFTQELETLREVPEPGFLGNSHKVGNAKYCFLAAIEACIDIGPRSLERMPVGTAKRK